MPPAKKKSHKPIHTQLGFRLKDYAIRINAGINYDIGDSHLSTPKSPIYSIYNSFELTGECCYPEERAGVEYAFSIYGEEPGEDKYNALLEDYHVRDKDGAPKYRKRGENSTPIYDPPGSIGFISQGRKGGQWRVCAWVPAHTASDILTLLSCPIPLYIALHEVKDGRKLQVRGITLQSTDPADE